MNPLREKNSEGDFVVLHQMVLMESRATLRKIALCGSYETASSYKLLKPFEQSE